LEQVGSTSGLGLEQSAVTNYVGFDDVVVMDNVFGDNGFGIREMIESIDAKLEQLALHNPI